MLKATGADEPYGCGLCRVERQKAREKERRKERRGRKEREAGLPKEKEKGRKVTKEREKTTRAKVDHGMDKGVAKAAKVAHVNAGTVVSWVHCPNLAFSS